jgi:hypothetical protein
MNKMTKEKLELVILIGLMSLLVSGLLITFIWQRQFATLSGQQSKISYLKSQIRTAEDLKKLMPIVTRNLDEAMAKLTVYETNMVEEGLETYRVQSYCQQVAKEEGLDGFFQAFTLSGQLADPMLLPKIPYKAAAVTVVASGFYEEIGRFIAHFENKYPYMRIQNLSLVPEGRVGSTTTDAAAPNEKLKGVFDIIVMKRAPGT